MGPGKDLSADERPTGGKLWALSTSDSCIGASHHTTPRNSDPGGCARVASQARRDSLPAATGTSPPFCAPADLGAGGFISFGMSKASAMLAASRCRKLMPCRQCGAIAHHRIAFRPRPGASTPTAATSVRQLAFKAERGDFLLRTDATQAQLTCSICPNFLEVSALSFLLRCYCAAA